MANSPMGMNGVPDRRRIRPTRPAGSRVPIAGILAIGILVIGRGLPAPLAAQEQREDSPGELATEAIDRLMRALDLLIGAIPQFEAPYINENGDILIRRKHGEDKSLPTPQEKPTPPSGPDTTTT